MSSYDAFLKDLSWSEKKMPEAIAAYLAEHGGQMLHYSLRRNDGGIDAVWLINGLVLYVDFKILRRGWRGDFPIEYAVEFHDGGRKSGWAIDPSKTTAVYVFYWTTGNKYRVNLRALQAGALRVAALANRELWLSRYGRWCQFNHHKSHLAFVPPEVLEAAMTPEALVYGLGG